MKFKNDPVRIEFKSRGGDSPFGWSNNALHLKLFDATIETFRESAQKYVENEAKKMEKTN